jgi:hypothetical protein
MTRRYAAGLSRAEKAPAGIEGCFISVSWCDRLRAWVVMDGAVMVAHFADQADALGYARRFRGDRFVYDAAQLAAMRVKSS